MKAITFYAAPTAPSKPWGIKPTSLNAIQLTPPASHNLNPVKHSARPRSPATKQPVTVFHFEDRERWPHSTLRIPSFLCTLDCGLQHAVQRASFRSARQSAPVRS